MNGVTAFVLPDNSSARGSVADNARGGQAAQFSNGASAEARDRARSSQGGEDHSLGRQCSGEMPTEARGSIHSVQKSMSFAAKALQKIMSEIKRRRYQWGIESMGLRQSVEHQEERHGDHSSYKERQKEMNTILFDDVVTARNRHANAQLQADIRFLIMPWSRFLTAWRSLMVFAVLWAVLFAPLEIAFSWWTPSTTISVISRLVDGLMILDMFMNLFIVTVKYGRLVTKRRKIIMLYLKSWFVLDMITNIPWDLVFQGESGGKSRKMIKALKLPKVLRLTRLFRVAREEAHTLGTVFTISGMLLLSHYVSCLWVTILIDCQEDRPGQKCPDMMSAYTEGFSVGMASLSGSDAWLRFILEGQFQSSADSDNTFDWKKSPGIGVELVAVFTSLIGLCSLGVLFSNIARAMDKQDSHTRKFNERLQNVKAAANQHNLSKDIYSRARRHFHYVWSCGSDSSRELLADQALSVDLRRELAFSFYGDMLRKVPFLANSEENLLKRICKNATMEVFSPLDNILMAGDMGTELFFLVSGSVTVRNPLDDAVLRTLDEGSFFGEVALFFPEHGHSVNVQAKSFGWLLVVEREHLTELCSEELLEEFRHVAIERAEHEFVGADRIDYADGLVDETVHACAIMNAQHKTEAPLATTSSASPGSAREPPQRISVFDSPLLTPTPAPANVRSSQTSTRSTLTVASRQSSRDAEHCGQLSNRDSLARRRSSRMSVNRSLEHHEVEDLLWDFASQMEAKIDTWVGAIEQRLASLPPKEAVGTEVRAEADNTDSQSLTEVVPQHLQSPTTNLN